jgi:nuclear pore complex protein Nup62
MYTVNTASRLYSLSPHLHHNIVCVCVCVCVCITASLKPHAERMSLNRHWRVAAVQAHAAPGEIECSRMLTYAHVCSHMLTYAQARCAWGDRVLRKLRAVPWDRARATRQQGIYVCVYVCMLMYADNADVCWHELRGSKVSMYLSMYPSTRYLCIYVCIHLCVCMYVCMYADVCWQCWRMLTRATRQQGIYVSIYVSIYKVSMYLSMYPSMCVCMYVCMYVCMMMYADNADVCWRELRGSKVSMYLSVYPSMCVCVYVCVYVLYVYIYICIYI